MPRTVAGSVAELQRFKPNLPSNAKPAKLARLPWRLVALLTR